jgi:formylglycine-generating enzyme required for sulfatase activity/very-short-patch-repair endonuclease
LSGLASLFQWQDLFATGRGVVKLTAKGVSLANRSNIKSLSETQKIASAVIHYAGTLHDIRLKVQKVAQVATVGNKVLQALYVDLVEDHLPSDTPVRLFPNGSRAMDGKITGQEPDGTVIYVAFDTQVFQEHLPATLCIDRGILLKRLADQIDTLTFLPDRMTPLLNGTQEGFLIADKNSIEVTSKLASLQTPWTRLLWGPPGAGKTYGLGHLVATLLRNNPNQTILLVAPSNRAVDVVLEAAIGRLRAAGLERLIQDRKVVRFGYARKAEIIDQPQILGPSILDALNKEVKSISVRIKIAEKAQANDAELALLRTNILAAQEAVKTALNEHIKSAAVVATTTTLAYLPTSPISSRQWDTVLVDEVTMVTPAMCTFLASLAKERFLLAGDPRQLGPVYENGKNATSEDFEWMGRDIFDKSGVSSGGGEERQIKSGDARLARITSQRRCALGIWGRVKHLYPEVADETDHVSLQHLIQLIPSPGEAVVCLDTSTLQAECEKYKGSWQNPMSADVAMELAKSIVAEAPNPIRIAIITPYRAQVRLLQKILRAERNAEITPYAGNEIEVGTVHQFQGSDADIVIFDVVDGHGRNDVGNLLKNDDGLRLVNVAITRAKGKLIVIADKEWCKRVRIYEANALLGELVLGKRPAKTLTVKRHMRETLASRIATSSERDKAESPIETALFDAMAKSPILATVCSQVVVRDESGIPISRADFAFEDLKYAIYCDGRKWHLKEDRWEVDLRQRNKLAENGWIFSVFSGSQIFRDAESCVAQIEETYWRRLEGEDGTKTRSKALKRGGTNQGELVFDLPPSIGGSEDINVTEKAVSRREQNEGDCTPKDKLQQLAKVPIEKKGGQLFTNILGISFAWIPPGSFQMGSPADEKEREEDEILHMAGLSKGFYLGIHLVTQAQWAAVIGNNPSQFKGDDLPVEKVSWNECIVFCEKLGKKDGKRYRLPTEMEWEYACRAGTAAPFCFGATISTEQANFDGRYTYGKGSQGVPRRRTTPVAQFPLNGWGLYDMHGNVWEWCSDWYGGYPKDDCTDYPGSKSGTVRVLRGGAWNQIPKRCRSAYRNSADPKKGRKDVGFRICFSED